MKNIVPVIVLFLAVLAATPSYALTLDCYMDRSAEFDGTATGVTSEHGPDKYNKRIVIEDVETPAPTLKGTISSGPARILKRTAETVWIVQYPDSGGVFLFTVFPKDKFLIYSKQYVIEDPFGYMAMGRCK